LAGKSPAAAQNRAVLSADDATVDSIPYRFVIEALLTAQVSSHADISARMPEHLVARKQHYDKVVIPGLRGMGAAGPEDRKLMGASERDSSSASRSRRRPA
jgi:hypothetical protein